MACFYSTFDFQRRIVAQADPIGRCGESPVERVDVTSAKASAAICGRGHAVIFTARASAAAIGGIRREIRERHPIDMVADRRAHLVCVATEFVVSASALKLLEMLNSIEA